MRHAPDARVAPTGAPEMKASPPGAPEMKAAPAAAPDVNAAPDGAPEMKAAPDGALDVHAAPDGAPDAAAAPAAAPAVAPQPAADPYGIRRWGGDYVAVLPNGHVGLRDPGSPEAPPVDLIAILRQLDDRGIKTPLVLRVTSYLERQIARICDGFSAAMEAGGYRGVYRGVYPIKVNQQAAVVEAIVAHGRSRHFGLEVGSKPELVIALSQPLGPEALVICNGIKDAEFVRLALLSLRLGFNTVIVLESPKELDVVLAEARALGITPRLGARIKLSQRVGGQWSASSGDRSAFGMTTDQLIDLVDRLRAEDLLDALVLQHAHLGSQIPDVIDVRRAVAEACRYYVELRREGVGLTHLDLGGGLGIDYTGENRSSANSINYTVEEYCENVVETVQYALDEAGVPHPTLVTESGRATVAASSMLIFDILEATHFDTDRETAPEAGDSHAMADLAAVPGYLSRRRIQECLNDANYYRGELRAQFAQGRIGLREMARGERIFLYAIGRIKEFALAQPGGAHEDVHAALDDLADIYHGNFSLFQSLPDSWAIDQLHPIAPLQRLHEPADRRAVISDITCDSDGKVDRFVLAGGVGRALPVHPLRAGEPYYLGVFFVGAYQETLGDLHNLFGDTNVVTIALRGDGGFDLIHEVEGDTVSEVLSYVEYQPGRMLDAFKARVETAVSGGTLSTRERRATISAYKDVLGGYTYYDG